jgi:hypothetical protein
MKRSADFGGQVGRARVGEGHGRIGAASGQQQAEWPAHGRCPPDTDDKGSRERAPVPRDGGADRVEDEGVAHGQISYGVNTTFPNWARFSSSACHCWYAALRVVIRSMPTA